MRHVYPMRKKGRGAVGCMGERKVMRLSKKEGFGGGGKNNTEEKSIAYKIKWE